MAEYVGIPADLFRAIVDHFRQQDEIATRLNNLKPMHFSFGRTVTDGEPDVEHRYRERKPEPETPLRKYTIGRKRGNWSYADVAAKLLDRDEFPFDWAAEVILPRITVKGGRPRDSLRMAMDADKRFERIPPRGPEDIWYRRTDRKESPDPELEL